MFDTDRQTAYRSYDLSGADIKHTQQWQTVSGQLGNPVCGGQRKVVVKMFLTC